MNGHDLDRARDALHAISPGLPRDEWVRVGMAAQAAGLGFDDFDAWSAQADNYEARAARDTWRSFNPDGRTGAGSLFYLARAEGWSDKGEHAARNAPTKPAGGPAEPRKAPRPGTGAAEVWRRLETAAVGHPYIVAKQGNADGLRVVPAGDPLRIAGHSVAGWLVVPVLPLAGGEPTSLQFIPPPGAGRKLNLPGARLAGVFTVGDLAPGGTAYLCEGIGQAWACWKATGAAAVVCFGWGRVRAVAAELRQRQPSARLVLVPDVGKEAEAETIAREVAGSSVELPEGWPINADVNDYAQREGFDALELLLSGASEPAAPEHRFKLLTGADLHALPPLTWRIRGVLPAEGIASICGPSSSGKSFLELDMAAAIAEGRDWFGFRVKACPVVLVCLEGAAGFRLRVAAWEKHYGRTLPAGLSLVLQPFKLTETDDVEDMAAAVLSAGVGAVTFIDTLNASAPGVDENSSADMGRILDAAKDLQARTGGLVVLVHHTGKDATKGMRGHSSLYAAMDAVIAVSRDSTRKQWTTNPAHGGKSKDGADGDAHPFVLDVVELAPDDEGQPVTSCVVRIDGAADDVARVPVPQGENQRLVYEGIRGLFKDGPKGKPGAPALRPCIELEAAVMAGAARLACPTDKRTSRARTAISGLVARGVLGLNEGWLWTV